jgi:hypothetical protein
MLFDLTPLDPVVFIVMPVVLDDPDGGPLRYRVVHTASLRKPGERPLLRQQVIEGDPGLSIGDGSRPMIAPAAILAVRTALAVRRGEEKLSGTRSRSHYGREGRAEARSLGYVCQARAEAGNASEADLTDWRTVRIAS